MPMTELPTNPAPVVECDECGQNAAAPWLDEEPGDCIDCINEGCPGYMFRTGETREVTW